jgi:hypothetical protein
MRGDAEELRARADVTHELAAAELARMLAERGDAEELRARADAGDRYAARELARMLAERGDLDQAEQIWRARTDAGDEYAAGELARMLAERGDAEELRARADAGDGRAPRGWLGCWPSAGTWTRPSRCCAPVPSSATGTPSG